MQAISKDGKKGADFFRDNFDYIFRAENTRSYKETVELSKELSFLLNEDEIPSFLKVNKGYLKTL